MEKINLYQTLEKVLGVYKTKIEDRRSKTKDRKTKTSSLLDLSNYRRMSLA